MPRAPKPKVDIKADVKVVLAETLRDNSKIQLRVVNWIAEGKDTGAKFEKRSFFKKQDGSFSEQGSCKGLNKADIELLIANWDELKVFF